MHHACLDVHVCICMYIPRRLDTLRALKGFDATIQRTRKNNPTKRKLKISSCNTSDRRYDNPRPHGVIFHGVRFGVWTPPPSPQILNENPKTYWNYQELPLEFC